MATLSQPTLERLIREVRVALRQRKAENSRWDDAELGSYLNDGIAQYFLHLNEVAEGQFDKKTTLSIVASSETVALPTDCYAVKALYKVQSQTNVILKYDNNMSESYENNPANSSSSYQPSYYFRENNLVLRPIPSFSETGGLVIEYTAFPEVMIYGGDVMSAGISPMFKELVIAYAVHKAKEVDDLVSNGNTRQAAAERLSDLYQNFKHQVMERSKYPQFIKPFDP